MILGHHVSILNFLYKLLSLSNSFFMTASNDSYISFTLHWIDKDWVPHALQLGCLNFPGHHSSIDISNKIEEMVRSWNINFNNVVACVTDNEATMNAAGRELNFDWQGCHDHLLELVVKSCLKDQETKSAIEKARGLVRYLKTPLALHALMNDQITMPPKRSRGDTRLGASEPIHPHQDVPTRWWSSFDMCSTLDRLRGNIESLSQRNIINQNLTSSEWAIIEILSIILQPFYEVQKMLEGQNYITISMVPCLITMLRENIDQILVEFQGGPIHNAAEAMKSKFEEKWGSGQDGTVFNEHKREGNKRIKKGLTVKTMLSAALDPRTKGMKYFGPKDRELVREELKKQLKEIIRSQTDVNGDRGTSQKSSVSSAESSNLSFIRSSKMTSMLADDIPETNTESEIERKAVQELQTLFYSTGLDKDKNPLTWWKIKEREMPFLAMLARAFLAIPATSAPSERVFSSCGRFIERDRYRLLTESVEELIFLKGNWEAAIEFQKQNIKKDDNE
jgi:hypothetical protein